MQLQTRVFNFSEPSLSRKPILSYYCLSAKLQRRSEIYFYWSTADSDPLPGFAEDDLFEAVMAEFEGIVEDANSMFMDLYGLTTSAGNIATFDVSPLERFIHEDQSRTLRPGTPFPLWIQFEHLNHIYSQNHSFFFQNWVIDLLRGHERSQVETYRLEYATCAEGLSEWLQFKQQANQCSSRQYRLFRSRLMRTTGVILPI